MRQSLSIDWCTQIPETWMATGSEEIGLLCNRLWEEMHRVQTLEGAAGMDDKKVKPGRKSDGLRTGDMENIDAAGRRYGGFPHEHTRVKQCHWTNVGQYTIEDLGIRLFKI
ncbi:hypothetical protein PG989_006831 [Apiospora arundinis]